ncbi:[protein-PII] uridylyltransferase [Oceanicola sp. 502str15]|nr:[protein-PII] uridylyltransferase [Oceanicola sp. 502str15]MCO6384565.1 [protein-PII] uridylyltransferase [Oceanicola sp. 502str15]
MICAPEEIIDTVALARAIEDACAEAGSDPMARRAAVTRHLNAAAKAGRTAIGDAFEQNPLKAREMVHAYAYLTDGLVVTAFWFTRQFLHPLPNPTSAEHIALCAVGGYGRAEMSPHSDVDLLFLTPYKITPWAESVIESTLYILWDLHMKVGHASRTVKECMRLGKQDYTIRTSLIELRFLAGDRPLEKELHDKLHQGLFAGTGKEFIEAKLDERTERHKKQGGQRYMLEPNVKEGKGGLRDLQSLFWIAKYIHHVDEISQLVPLGVFTPEEFTAFEQAENFLWAVRAHLHLLAGRPADQLTFDMQIEVAARMGYADSPGRRAVEHFMQDYFRHATMVGELTRIFLTALEADHVKRLPHLVGLLRRRRVKPGYEVRQMRLDVKDEDAFLADKLNLLHIFEEALRTGLLIHPDAMRLVTANLDLIDDEMRADPEAARIFLGLLLKHGNPERALRRMNELGVLSAFIPEFAPIVAMMQFNIYHHYTVDEHTIQTISELAEIERGELIEDLPVASRILKAGVNRKVIYLALLFHDIGKGREEDHSVLGAKIARAVLPRFHLKPREAEDVEWLVRYHLLMSDMAQKRDLSDPRTIRSFARAVKTKKRLDLLTVLTVCDIRGVGPGTWNNWKAQLLRNLYRQTADGLENGLEDLNRDKQSAEARRQLREALGHWDKADLRTELARHYDPYLQGLSTATQVIIANMLQGIGNDEIRIDLTPDDDRDATRAAFALSDHPGIFARIAGALALVGANVVDARTYTTKDGFATPVFWIQDAEGNPYSIGKLDRLRAMISKTLKGEVLAREALTKKDKFKKREMNFRFPTTVSFDNEGSEIYTIIEVDTRDRPGLLYDLARTLSERNLQIASAVVATYGAQAVDSFYVKDMFGLKVHSESKQKALETRLKAAVQAGTDRANG